MRDILFFIAGLGVWAAACYGMFIFTAVAFALWFAYYILVQHWKEQRQMREREARRAKYAAEKAAAEAEDAKRQEMHEHVQKITKDFSLLSEKFEFGNINYPYKP